MASGTTSALHGTLQAAVARLVWTGAARVPSKKIDKFYASTDAGARYSDSKSEGETSGVSARCCKCGPHWKTPWDSVVWSLSGICRLQCQQFFRTEPDALDVIASQDCQPTHAESRRLSPEKKSRCRDACRDEIQKLYRTEEEPQKGPQRCTEWKTPNGCHVHVDPAKAAVLFAHAEQWWTRKGGKVEPRSDATCKMWVEKGVCSRSPQFMLAACAGSLCQADFAGKKSRQAPLVAQAGQGDRGQTGSADEAAHDDDDVHEGDQPVKGKGATPAVQNDEGGPSAPNGVGKDDDDEEDSTSGHLVGGPTPAPCNRGPPPSAHWLQVVIVLLLANILLPAAIIKSMRLWYTSRKEAINWSSAWNGEFDTSIGGGHGIVDFVAVGDASDGIVTFTHRGAGDPGWNGNGTFNACVLQARFNNGHDLAGTLKIKKSEAILYWSNQGLWKRVHAVEGCTSSSD